MICNSNVSIYHTINPALVKRVREAVECHEAEFQLPKKSEGPEYLAFVNSVMRAAARFDSEGPPEWKLYPLWWVSKTFRDHWYGATKDTSRYMAWVCFIYGLSKNEAGFVVLAWMYEHGRTPSQSDLRRELTEMLKTVWKEVQPELKKARAKRNEKRRVKYRKERNDMNTKRGRPKQTGPDCLGSRIIRELQQGRSTPQILSATLNATAEAVRSHLVRMMKVGFVNRPAKGVYELAKTNGVAPEVFEKQKDGLGVVPESAQATPIVVGDPADYRPWFVRLRKHQTYIGPKEFAERFHNDRMEMIEYVIKMEQANA